MKRITRTFSSSEAKSHSYFVSFTLVVGHHVVVPALLCRTLCDPMDYSLPGFSVLEILQLRILEWVVISFSRGFPDPGIESCLLHLLHWQQILYQRAT